MVGQYTSMSGWGWWMLLLTYLISSPELFLRYPPESPSTYKLFQNSSHNGRDGLPLLDSTSPQRWYLPSLSDCTGCRSQGNWYFWLSAVSASWKNPATYFRYVLPTPGYSEENRRALSARSSLLSPRETRSFPKANPWHHRIGRYTRSDASYGIPSESQRVIYAPSSNLSNVLLKLVIMLPQWALPSLVLTVHTSEVWSLILYPRDLDVTLVKQFVWAVGDFVNFSLARVEERWAMWLINAQLLSSIIIFV